MTVLTDAELYRRGARTLLASWEEYARGAAGATVQRFPGVAAAIFPNEPERAVYNNALLEPYLGASGRADALEAMEAAYAEARVTRFAAWVRESDQATRSDLEQRGYTLDASTRSMGTSLDDIRLPRPEIELGPPDWSEYLRILGVPPGLLAGADHDAFHVLVARLAGENVATAMAFDHDADGGIYNVTTLDHARRRGLGTALTALHLHDALARGCRTASLQSTPMAEGVYTAVGFRDLGRILEYVPSSRVSPPLDTARVLLRVESAARRGASSSRVSTPKGSGRP
jgi:ribosomal protein S18 acetylase RimI-like enzyme